MAAPAETTEWLCLELFISWSTFFFARRFKDTYTRMTISAAVSDPGPPRYTVVADGIAIESPTNGHMGHHQFSTVLLGTQ